MQVLFGDSHDICHELDAPGAYEWWYTDARSADGQWGFVVILFRGMPMSPDYLAEQAQGRRPHPRDHCGYAVSVYHRGKRVLQAFRGVERTRCSFSTTSTDVVVGPCTLAGMADGAWRIVVDTSHPDAPRRVTIDATIRRRHPLASSDAPFTHDHGWVLVAPDADADVRVQMFEDGIRRVDASWAGRAYRDHNMGRRAMQDDFDTWWWGRVHNDTSATVYLAVPDATEPFAWAATFDAQGMHEHRDVHVVAVARRRTLMGLREATRLHLDAGAWSMGVDQHMVIDDGPFYRRYLATMHADARSAIGISEDMHVRRYRAAWIRPFLRTPWLRQ
jgi:carotenoid 1,2-hydratase